MASGTSRAIYIDWMQNIQEIPGKIRDQTLDDEESPVLATVDHTFWSETDIHALRSRSVSNTPRGSEAGNEPSAVDVKTMATALPFIFGCPLPPSCFSW